MKRQENCELNRPGQIAEDLEITEQKFIFMRADYHRGYDKYGHSRNAVVIILMVRNGLAGRFLANSL